MEPGPSQIVEPIVGSLIPPACREEVLGDLRERHPTAAPFLFEAARVVPCVVYSRIRRTTDPVLALTEAVSLYTAFVMAAWWLDRPGLLDQFVYARLAIPPVLFFAAVILSDAYSHPHRRFPLKPLFAPALGLALAWLAQSVLHSFLKPWALAPSVLAWGSAFSLILLSTLRLTFPPIPDRPQSIHVPAFWQRLELAPLATGLKSAKGAARTAKSGRNLIAPRVVYPLRVLREFFKRAILLGVIVLAVIVYLLRK